ncbi:LacI family DNA-binding transcriptional regulator [Ruficoccus sp. ZRK36]|uniref:LacI family DNA-binding transcriptional regulator n=1 Tax=Ruficoccus sp. ZRK36 TaxID=2866311 RepID=UPI001C735C5D|nr:LacI family DNA-binding transcriptional regulator [Ruficoccus sp. ZRK36]QYY35011.1 LacI family transcriptional regulator [Ruficoccus sp. ZRK36]
MSNRVTIREIAQKAGVHHATVSRALRNDPQIATETREHILKLARRMGYRPDPALSSLMRYRSAKAAHHYQAALAWATNYPTRDGWLTHEKVGYYSGALQRAEELGYSLDPFWLGEAGMSGARASAILKARNIQGVILLPMPKANVSIDLDWDQFSAVSISHTVTSPHLNVVTNHHFRSMALLMKQLDALGYKRPGFACLRRIHESVDRAWAAAFEMYRPGAGSRADIPLYIYEEESLPAFEHWVRTYKPDVIVAHSDNIMHYLKEMQLRVPEDIGVAMAARHGVSSDCSGIDENNNTVGRVVVNVVVEMIHNNERGIPQVPITTLVEGFWVNGSTLRTSL